MYLHLKNYLIMVIRLTLLLFLGLTLMANGCDPSDIEQGIAGKVLWIEGNQMPGIIDENASEESRKRPAPNGIRRSIHIYELTNTSQAQGTGVFYNNLHTKLIKTVTSDEEGNFAVALPTGRYSVFVEEEEGLFANLMDGEGNLNPVEVTRDSVSTLTIEVNYKAAY